MMSEFIYLDYNATTPVDPRVAEAMQPFLTGAFGNPSSTHRLGREARRAVDRARAQVALCLGSGAAEVVFTSGGSEANNLAIRGVVASHGSRGHVITSVIEHPAVLEVVRALEREGRISLTTVGVDQEGRVDASAIADAIRSDTVLVTLMLANNEVGTLQPVKEVAEICRARGVLVHTDAAQAVGKISVDVGDLGVDLLSVAGHKLYAPKGIGALFIRDGVRVEPLIRGAAHEMGLRAGTENVLEIVGLGAACQIVHDEVDSEPGRVAELRDRLFRRLVEKIPDLVRHGSTTHGLPNTLNVSLPGIDANLLLTRLGEDLAASAGAACHAEEVEVSHVLDAMKVDQATALSAVRLSVGRFTTEEEVDEGGRRILALVAELRGGTTQVKPPMTSEEPRLTQFTHGLGCACKLQPQLLAEIVDAMPPSDRAEVVIGPGDSDDACAWKLEDDTVLVQSVDFFTPVVDSPRRFGAIAAANAVSDIYAMGAEPLFALNIAAFPIASLSASVLQEILDGAQEVAEEIGIPILGGHTVEDNEPKFGWVVTGKAASGRLWRNAGAKPGDVLVLTKPLGTGVWATAAKHGVAPIQGWERAQEVMRFLNRDAAIALAQVGPSAACDVTGFGLLGHLREMAKASGVEVELWCDAVPVLPGTDELIAAGEIPGGTRSNLTWSENWTTYDSEVPQRLRVILADAQTNGGLIAAVSRERVSELIVALEESEHDAAAIGVFTGWGDGIIRCALSRHARHS